MSRYMGITLTLGLCVALAGCHRSWENWYQKGKGFDTWEKKIEKFDEYRRDFGEISVSPPIVVTDPSQFSLKFNKSAEQLYAEAGKPQVAARIGRFDVTSFQGSVGVQAEAVPAGTAIPFAAQAVTGLIQTILDNAGVDPKPDGDGDDPKPDGADADPQIALDLLNTLLGVAQPATEPTAVPAREPMAVPGLPSNLASDRLRELSDAANVLGPLQADVSASPFAKATEAANAHYHMKLFELFSDPRQFALSPDQTPMLFAGSITVSPGSVTEKHFLAEITMRLKVLDNEEKEHAVDVVSAFPSTVGQNMDLQSLVALQRDFAGQLQAAGFGAAANALFSTSSAFQSNARSLNQRVTISAFNRDSTRHVGWRVRGEYWAYNPDDADAVRPDLVRRLRMGRFLDSILFDEPMFESGAAVLMQDVTIPVVMIGLVPEDLWHWVELAQDVAPECRETQQQANELVRLARELLKAPPGASELEASEIPAASQKLEKLEIDLKDVTDSAYGILEPFKVAQALKGMGAALPDPQEAHDSAKVEQLRARVKKMQERANEMAQACAEVRNRIRFDVTTRWLPADRYGRKHLDCYPELKLIEALYRAEVATALELEMKEDHILAKRTKCMGELLSDEDKKKNISDLKECQKLKRLKHAPDDGYKQFVDAWGDSAWRSVVGPGISAFQIKVPVPEGPAEPEITKVYPAQAAAEFSTRRTTILVVEGKHFGKSPRFICAGLDTRTLGVFNDGTIALVEVNPALIKSGETLTGALVVVTKGGYAKSTETISFMTKKGSNPATPQTTITIDKNYKPQKDSEPKTRITVEEKGGGAKAEVFKALHHCTDILCTICNP